MSILTITLRLEEKEANPYASRLQITPAQRGFPRAKRAGTKVLKGYHGDRATVRPGHARSEQALIEA